MNISITGGNGFVGQEIVNKLLSLTHKIKVLTRFSNCSSHNELSYVKGNLLDEEPKLDDFLYDCDVIIHCAGELYDESLMEALHVEGTKKLLNAILQETQRSKKRIHWIQLSSVGTYGSPPDRLNNSNYNITELTLDSPANTYEVTKTKSDNLVIEYAKNNFESLTYTILRPSIIFGETMKSKFLYQLVKMIQKRMFFYIGDKIAIATYVHVDDVVKALLLCLDNHKSYDKIYILSNDCLLKDIVDAVCAKNSISNNFIVLPENAIRLVERLVRPIPLMPLTMSRINSLVSKTTYSSEKIKIELNYAFQVNVPNEIANLTKTPN